MKKIILYLVLVIIYTSCSQKTIVKLLSKTPKITYQKPTNYDKLNKYQQDAIYLIHLVKQSYPRLNTKISDENFFSASEILIKKLSNTTNQQDFEIEIKKFVALLKDGHSNVSINYNDQTRFHIYLVKVKKDWIIWTLDKSLDSIFIGSRLISINGKNIIEINKLVNLFESGENESWRLKHFGIMISSPKYLEAVGIINRGENLQISCSSDNKIRNIEIVRKDKSETHKINRNDRKYKITKKQNEGFYYTVNKNENYAYLQMNTSLDYVAIKSEINNYTNFLTRPIALSYLRKNKKDARNFGLTLQSLFKKIHINHVENLIIDLRHNTGGDERTGKQLIWYLTNKSITGFTEYLNISDFYKSQLKTDYKNYNKLYKQKYNKTIPNGEINITKEFYNNPYFYDITKKESPFLLDRSIPKFTGKVYVLIGHNTFSAGQVLATTIADNNLATLVGKPTGNKPSTQTGTSLLKLPHTKLLVSLSFTFMERPDKDKNNEKTLYPDIEIHHTYEQIMNNDDKSFEYIINTIKNKK